MKPRWIHYNRAERVLAGRYPFGIARRLLNVKQNPIASGGPVLFIASRAETAKAGVVVPFIGPQGELLAKAITQGLKWNLDSARLIFAAADQGSLDAETLASIIKELRPRAIVAMGNDAEQVVGMIENNQGAKIPSKEGQVVSISDTQVMVTKDLRDVLINSDVKKSFWQDLKALAERFA